MWNVVLREKPDHILHLGDVVRDAQRLHDALPDIPLDQVRGNCDVGCYDVSEEKELFVMGRRLWMLHGHGYGVKLGIGLMLSEARSRGRRWSFSATPTRPCATGMGGCGS